MDEPNAELMTNRRDGIGHVPLRAPGCPAGVIGGKGRQLADDEIFFGADGSACGEAFGDEEAVGGDGQRRMMVKPPPAVAFVVSEAQFLLQLLIVALDAPAHVRAGDQVVDRRVDRQVRQEAFQRFGIAGRPFDQ